LNSRSKRSANFSGVNRVKVLVSLPALSGALASHLDRRDDELLRDLAAGAQDDARRASAIPQSSGRFPGIARILGAANVRGVQGIPFCAIRHPLAPVNMVSQLAPTLKGD
jgi:hypothetical protein